MSPYAGTASAVSYPVATAFTTQADGLRSNEPGKVLALPNGGEHRVGTPDNILYVSQSDLSLCLSPYGYGSYVPTGTTTCSGGDDDAGRGTSRRLPGPVVEDSPGCNLRPDPVAEATDAASLIRALNDFRAWAGDVSYRDMERGCNRLRSSSALHRVLTGDQMPTQTDVRAVILGCGGTDDDVSRYVSAWRKIRSPHRAPAPVALPGPRVVAVTAAKKAS